MKNDTNNMINSETSLRLNLLRFPLVVGIVFIHSYASNVGFNNGGISLGLNNDSIISLFIRNLISQEIARVSVPTFFLISGYLFFIGFNWSIVNFLNKINSRFNTLLIPFLFWNIATLLVIALGQSISFTQPYFSGKNPFISNFNFLDYMRYIFGVGVNPIAYPLWFIRDLMLLCLLSPVILFFNKYIYSIWNGLLLYFWFLSQWPIYSPSIDALLFFSLGCFKAINNKNLFSFDKFGKLFVSAYLLTVVTGALFYGQFVYLQKIGILIGIITVLYSTKFLANLKIKSVLLRLSNASFFIFAAHEPLLSFARKIAYKGLDPKSDLLVLTLYFVIPITVIIFLVWVYQLLKLSVPTFLHLITGRRSTEQ